MFLGDWLCSGKGIQDANIPKIVLGCISQCVNLYICSVLLIISLGTVAIIDQLCSSGSIYSKTDSSITLLVNRSSQFNSYVLSLCIMSLVNKIFLPLTRKTGLVNLPLSLHTRISFIL